MASEDKPDEAAADDGMADWAEALLEQKATDGAAECRGGPVGRGTQAIFFRQFVGRPDE